MRLFASACSPFHITLRPRPAAASPQRASKPRAARAGSPPCTMIHLSMSANSLFISLPRCELLTSLCRRERRRSMRQCSHARRRQATCIIKAIRNAAGVSGVPRQQLKQHLSRSDHRIGGRQSGPRLGRVLGGQRTVSRSTQVNRRLSTAAERMAGTLQPSRWKRREPLPSGRRRRPEMDESAE